jgi:hypothetical protein
MRNENGKLRVIGSALLAGLIAIIVNTLILELADWIPLITARGGLLKLLKRYAAEPLAGLGIADFWAALHLPGPETDVKSGPISSSKNRTQQQLPRQKRVSGWPSRPFRARASIQPVVSSGGARRSPRFSHFARGSGRLANGSSPLLIHSLAAGVESKAVGFTLGRVLVKTAGSAMRETSASE